VRNSSIMDIQAIARSASYSHSIVPGGLDVMS
jgi:hypothetical protein